MLRLKKWLETPSERKETKKVLVRTLQLKLVFLGGAQVGKSVLLRRLLVDSDGEPRPRPRPTLSYDLHCSGLPPFNVVAEDTGEIERLSVQVEYWDLGYQELFSTDLDSVFRGCDGVVYVVDEAKVESMRTVDSWSVIVKKYMRQSKKVFPCMLLVNTRSTHHHPPRGVDLASPLKPSDVSFSVGSKSFAPSVSTSTPLKLEQHSVEEGVEKDVPVRPKEPLKSFSHHSSNLPKLSADMVAEYCERSGVAQWHFVDPTLSVKRSCLFGSGEHPVTPSRVAIEGFLRHLLAFRHITLHVGADEVPYGRVPRMSAYAALWDPSSDTSSPTDLASFNPMFAEGFHTAPSLSSYANSHSSSISLGSFSAKSPSSTFFLDDLKLACDDPCNPYKDLCADVYKQCSAGDESLDSVIVLRQATVLADLRELKELT